LIHAPGDTINPLRPVEVDANTLNLLLLLIAQAIWRHLLLDLTRSKMTQLGHECNGNSFR
jgi:hypothetical protein